jgi:hypothetical protein
MIPAFEVTGLLPPGIHDATWDEIVARYGYTSQRLALLSGLKAGLDALRVAGCQRAYVDGSFVTAKRVPADYDVCWESAGVRVALLDPALRTFANRRAAQKMAFRGEFFPAEALADARRIYLDFFQTGRDGTPKGIVAIDLGGLP